MPRLRIITPIVLAPLLIAALMGCTPVSMVATPLPPASATAPVPTRTRRPVATAPSTLTPTLTATLRQSSTPTLTATVTTSPTTTLEPSSTPSPSPTPSETPTTGPTLFPMSIAAMRAGSYPGSDLTVDQQLDAGSNYQRYYVFYLSQGLKIYALLTLPNGPTPAGGWPGIIFAHDYMRPAQYRTTESFAADVDRLATAGYIVFDPDYRGYGHSEGGDPQGAYGGPGYEIDLLNAISSLERFPQANPKKLGIWGQSMGGFLALRAMVISKDLKAGVIWNGVVAAYPDLLSNWPVGPATPPVNARNWMEDWPAQFGDPTESPAFWDSISANAFLSDLSGPLQLQMTLDDQQVPPQFSAILAQQIEAVGGEVEMYSYQNDDHDISANFSTAMDRTVAFFNKYLK